MASSPALLLPLPHPGGDEQKHFFFVFLCYRLVHFRTTNTRVISRTSVVT